MAPAEAVKWYRKAAEQNHALAQYDRGSMYQRGEGAAKDATLAYMYFSLAATTNADAVKVREALAKEMTPEQIAEGQRLTREWKPTAPTK